MRAAAKRESRHNLWATAELSSRSYSCSVLKVGLICALLLLVTRAIGQQSVAPDPNAQLLKTPILPSVHGVLTVAAVGDLLGPGRPITPLEDTEFEKVTRILRSADVATGNNEGAIFDIRKFNGYPAALNGGGDPVDDPAVARDLKAMGFTVLSKANNHATDFGIEGLEATNKSLEEAGILHVGSGRNLAEARSAVLIETPHGRVAVVAAASTFNPASPAEAPQGELNGRPGISVLRTSAINLVTAEEMAQLRAMAAARHTRIRGEGADSFLFGQFFRVGDKPGLTYQMNPYDESDILLAVRGAKQISNLTIFTIHAHETATGSADAPGQGNETTPGDFLPVLFHNVIDSGADIVLTHGPHYLRGIEIYKGKPIFYDLSSFFDDLELDRAPATRESLEKMRIDPSRVTYDEYLTSRFHLNPDSPELESVVAAIEFEGDHLKEVRLYPILLNRPGHELGIPYLAPPKAAKKILGDLTSMSAPLGTHIEVENNIGIIRPH